MSHKIALFVALVGLVVSHPSFAQVKPVAPVAPADPQTIHNHHYYGAVPAAGYGYGYPERGYSGGLAAGIGQGRLGTAQAAQTYAETSGQMIENHNYAVQSYYGNKEEHDKYVAAHMQGPVSQQQMQQYTKLADPGRLSASQFDGSSEVINWPALLRESDFTQERQKLDHLFHERTAEDSGADSGNYIQIKQACDAMLKTLTEKLRREKLPAVTFIAAEHFIKSVSYEGTFSVH